jgi:hypothetical protein
MRHVAIEALNPPLLSTETFWRLDPLKRGAAHRAGTVVIVG